MKPINKTLINRVGKISGILLILTILSVISYCIIKNFIFIVDDDFNYVIHHIYDNHIFFYDRICDLAKRFLPLQFFDYNILRIFNKDIRLYITPYYILLKFLLSVFLFVYIIKDIERFNKIKINFAFYVLLLLFFIVNVIMGIGKEVKYSELTQGLFILLFIYFYQKGYYTNKLKYYIVALLSCIYATYIKETMFIPFFVIGLSSLLFLNRNKLRNVVNLLLILNGIVYLIGYYIVYRSCNSDFVYKNLSEEIQCYTFYIILLFSIIRVYSFLKLRKISLYDAFLFAGCSFAVAMYKLNLTYGYYYWPAHIFLCVFLTYYFKTLSKIYMKFIVIIIMLGSVFFYTDYNYVYYKWHNQRYINTKIFFNLIKGKEIRYYCNNYSHNKYWAYTSILNMNKYIFNDKKITYFFEYNIDDIINDINNLQKEKEYVIFVDKDYMENLFRDIDFKLYPFNFFSFYYGHSGCEVFLLSPYK